MQIVLFTEVQGRIENPRVTCMIALWIEDMCTLWLPIMWNNNDSEVLLGAIIHRPDAPKIDQYDLIASVHFNHASLSFIQ